MSDDCIYAAMLISPKEEPTYGKGTHKSNLPIQPFWENSQQAGKVDFSAQLTGNDRYFIPMYLWHHPRGLKVGSSMATGMTKAVVS